MKYLLVLAFLAINPINDLDRIATINTLKKEAKTAYNNGNYKKALENYKYLLDSMEVKDDNVQLNLANAYYKLNDTTNAVYNYEMLTDSKKNSVRSVAQQQLGVMANKSKKYKEALAHFKEAIKADPANDDARYNYELLKKILKEQEQNKKDQQQNKDNKDQNKQDKKQQDQQQKEQQKQNQEQKEQEQQNQEQQQEQKDGKSDEQDQQDAKDQKGKEQEQKPQQPQDGEESDEESKRKRDQMSSLSDKLKDMKISKEKAEMILQALRNKEIQYFQQNKRKATKQPDSDKPDW